VTASGPDARLLRDLGIAGIHVPLAADAPLASEAAAGDDDGPLLLTVGDHEPMRRYGELLRALSHDDGEWRLVIAGNPSAFHGDVADEVKRLARVDSRVELRTGATLAAVDALMGRADLVLAASTGSVLAPTVVQAMAHGVPWIASPEYGGAADLAGGLVLDVGDFPAGVDHLLGDPRAHERLAAAGRAQFGRGHRWRESASRVDAMLRGVQELAPPPAAPDALAETEAVRAELLDALAAAPAGSTPYEPLPVEVLR
jgi:glycosyltransferase involved in cell wall biosynthesis